MDVLRRNTDYALRLMINLSAKAEANSVSTRTLAKEEHVSYQLACKLMQRLHRAGLVYSCMGPRGGFRLGRGRSRIALLEIIQAVQGPITLNRCLIRGNGCSRQDHCPVRAGLCRLQRRIDEYFGSITLADLTAGKYPRKTVTRREAARGAL
jgi:Rrf2 family protein